MSGSLGAWSWRISRHGIRVIKLWKVIETDGLVPQGITGPNTETLGCVFCQNGTKYSPIQVIPKSVWGSSQCPLDKASAQPGAGCGVSPGAVSSLLFSSLFSPRLRVSEEFVESFHGSTHFYSSSILGFRIQHPTMSILERKPYLTSVSQSKGT